MSVYKYSSFKNVRIVPMEYGEETIEEVQEEFFENRLPKKDKKYNCYGNGIMADEDDLLLFQYDNHIVASAIYIDCNKTVGEEAKEFKNHILIELGTIKTFKPISQDELNNYFVRDLRNAKHIIKKSEIKNIDDFLNRLELPR